MPNYNLFVTIDFVEHPDNMVEDGRYFDTDGANPTLPRGSC
ncbi:MAG: hypothetical protein U0840_15555 [Gemmataceae bacterium]